jgi:hypothetical protein
MLEGWSAFGFETAAHCCCAGLMQFTSSFLVTVGNNEVATIQSKGRAK